MDTSVSDSPKRKPRKALTLAERIKVIERKEKGESTKSIAAAFGVGLTQIVNIYANKQELKEKWERGDSANAKQTKRRKCPYEDLNEDMYDWFCRQIRAKISISGRMIIERACLISCKYGHVNFSGSNGWLEKWMERYNVSFASLSGERADVPTAVVEDWTERLERGERSQ